MNFINLFFTTIYKSCTDFKWLKDQRKDGNKAWGYFFTFMLLVVLIQTIAMLWVVPRGFSSFWTEAKPNIPEFHAEFTEGNLVIDGLEQPFIIDEEEAGERIRIIIDTQSELPIYEEVAFDDSLAVGVLITNDRISFYDGENTQVESQLFPEDMNWDFSRDDMVEFGDKFAGRILPLLIPILIFFLFVFWSVGKLIYLLIISLIVWIVGMFGKREWLFSEVYTMGLYAITLPTLISVLLASLIRPIPFLYTILLLVFMIGALFVGMDKKTVTPAKKVAKKKITKKTK